MGANVEFFIFWFQFKKKQHKKTGSWERKLALLNVGFTKVNKDKQNNIKMPFVSTNSNSF